MDLGVQQAEASLTMPIPMNYGSIHESSKFRMLGGPSVHSASSSMNGLASVQSSAGAAPPPRPPLTALPPPSTASTSQSQLEESLAPVAVAASRPTATPANSEQAQMMMGPIPNSASQANSKKPVKYRECLRNHAANIGGHALDGCGEFMPSGEESSLEALKCAACGCHRNFHRREVEGEHAVSAAGGCGFCTYSSPARALQLSIKEQSRRRFASLATLPPHPPLALLPPPPSSALLGPPRALAPLHMALHSPPDITVDDQAPDGPHLHGSSTSHAAMQLGMHHHHHFGGHSTSSSLKKRFRTKFSSEQKDRMFNFAEKLGWRIQKHDEAAVHQFCADVGIKRHVFKVWMHNNKNTFARKILPNEGGVAYLDNGGSSPTTSSGMQP